MSLLVTYIDTIDGIAKLLAEFLSRYFKGIRVGPFEFQLRREAAQAYAATFEKIERAQMNLAEAVEALDVLKAQYSEESGRLTRLLTDVNRKRDEAEQATRELGFLQNLTDQERTYLKQSLGLNDRRSKVIGFVGGVLASVLATSLWVGVPRAWELGSSWWGTPRGDRPAATEPTEPAASQPSAQVPGALQATIRFPAIAGPGSPSLREPPGNNRVAVDTASWGVGQDKDTPACIPKH